MVRWLINTNFLKKMFSIPSFLAVHGLHCCVGFSLVVATGGSFLVVVTGFSMQRLLLFQSTGSRVLRHQELQHVGSTDVAYRLSCSMAGGIFSDQGSNPCLLHWQAGSLPMSHQGRPPKCVLNGFYFLIYLFLAALSFHCFARTFSTCGEWGLLFIAVCGLPIEVASLVVQHGL